MSTDHFDGSLPVTNSPIFGDQPAMGNLSPLESPSSWRAGPSSVSPGASALESPQTESIEFRVRRTDAPVRRLRLTGNRYTFGSAEGCSIRLNDRTLRPMHAVLIRDGDRVLVRAYSVPVEVNQSRVTEAVLVVGDHLRLGEYEFELISVVSTMTHASTGGPGPIPPSPLQDGTRAALNSPAAHPSTDKAWAGTTNALPSGATASPSQTDSYHASFSGVSPTQDFARTDRSLDNDDVVWRQRLRREIDQWRNRQIECDQREQRCDDREAHLRGRESELWARAENLYRREAQIQSQESAVHQLRDEYALRQQELIRLRDEARQQQDILRRREADFASQELQYQQKLEETASQLLQSQSHAEAATAAVRQMREQFDALNQQIDSLSSQQEDLQQHEGRQRQEHQRLRLELEQQRDQAIDAQAESEAKRQEAEARVEEMAEQLESLRNSSLEAASLESTLLAENEQTINQLRDQVTELQNAVDEASQDASRLQQDYEESLESVRQLEALVAQSNERGDQDRTAWSNEADSLRAEIEKLSDDLKRTSDELATLRQSNEDLTARLEEVTRQRDEAVSTANDLPTHEALADLERQRDEAVEEMMSRPSRAEFDDLAHQRDEAIQSIEARPSVEEFARLSDQLESAQAKLQQMEEELSDASNHSENEPPAPAADSDSIQEALDAPEQLFGQEEIDRFDRETEESSFDQPEQEDQQLAPGEEVESSPGESHSIVESEPLGFSAAASEVVSKEPSDTSTSEASAAIDESVPSADPIDSDSLSPWGQPEASTEAASETFSEPTAEDSASGFGWDMAPEPSSETTSTPDADAPSVDSSMDEPDDQVWPTYETASSNETDHQDAAGPDALNQEAVDHGTSVPSEDDQESFTSWNHSADPPADQTIPTTPDQEEVGSTVWGHNDSTHVVSDINSFAGQSISELVDEPAQANPPAAPDLQSADDDSADSSTMESEEVQETPQQSDSWGDFDSQADHDASEEVENRDRDDSAEMPEGSLASMLIENLDADDSASSDASIESPDDSSLSDDSTDGTVLFEGTEVWQNSERTEGSGFALPLASDPAKVPAELDQPELDPGASTEESLDSQTYHWDNRDDAINAESSYANPWDQLDGDDSSQLASEEQNGQFGMPVDSSEEQDVDSNLSEEVPSDTQQSDAAPTESLSGETETFGGGEQDEDDDSIEAYMNRLLRRVQGEPGDDPSDQSESISLSTSTSTSVSSLNDSTLQDSTAAQSDTQSVPTEPIDPNAPLVPRSQAPERMSNLSAMRELANQSARSAINRSSERQTRNIQLAGYMNFAVAVFALLVPFGVTSFVSGGLIYLIAVLAMVVAGICVRDGLRSLAEVKQRQAPSADEDHDLEAESAVEDDEEPLEDV